MILGIYGAGGSGREVFELATIINSNNNRWSELIFIDDTKEEGEKLRGIPIYSFENLTKNIDTESIEIIISLGEPANRRKVAENVIHAGYHLATLIHPNVHIPESTKIGDGVIISCNAFISCDVIIEDNVMILPQSSVAHDNHIGKNTVIAGHSDLGGGVHIGFNTYIALNVCVREKTHIGDNVIVSAGSAVLKDVPDNVIIHGNPAKAIMKKDDRTVFR